jgi:hypothetical protein
MTRIKLANGELLPENATYTAEQAEAVGKRCLGCGCLLRIFNDRSAKDARACEMCWQFAKVMRRVNASNS